MTPLTDRKVIRHYGPHDIDALFDGQYIGSFKTRQEAQRALDDYVLGLCQDGLVDLPLTALEAAPTSQPCIHCGDIQARASCDACIEWADPDPEPVPPPWDRPLASVPDGTPVGEDIPPADGEPGRSAPGRSALAVA